jgi:hypothetical protein
VKPDPEPPADLDPVVRAYWDGVDVTLLRENLKFSLEERIRRHASLQRFAAEMRRAGEEFRRLQRETARS